MSPPTTPDELIFEIVFAPLRAGCSGGPYMYIYTSQKRILRTSSAPPDWNNFIDVTPGDLPPDTTGFRGVFAAVDQGSRTRLFYGNYSPSDIDPPSGVFVWHSDNCGNGWTTFPLGGGRQLHSIRADPQDSQKIYATIDTESIERPNPWYGLWRSADGGDTFQRVSENYVGIDFVFQSDTSKVLLESDGEAGFLGPLLSWDTTTPFADTQIAAPWPSTSGPSWAGSGHAIFLTSEQNIMLESVGEEGALSFRNGIWYLAPPAYDTAVLLEDLLPPIRTVTGAGTIASATTYEPHGLEDGETISVSHVETISVSRVDCGSSGASFDADDVTAMVTGPTSFTYNCSSFCPQHGNGGFVKKAHAPFLYPNRTVEVTAPSGVTYLYSNNVRIVKPRFVGQ